jgi:hypothetical protein
MIRISVNCTVCFLQRNVFGREVSEHVDLSKGYLICDDSTLDKLYSQKIEFVTRHWLGKHKSGVLDQPDNFAVDGRRASHPC